MKLQVNNLIIMKVIVNVFLLLCLTSFSCKENNTNLKQISNFENQSVDTLNLNKTLKYKSIFLKCVGEQYSASTCYNENEKIKISFSKESIDFSFNNIAFRNDQLNIPDDLGYQTFLFDNNLKKIVIIDFFLENGSMVYVYFYHKNNLKFLGKREIIFDEEINPKLFKVDQVKNDIIVSIGKNIKNLNFDLSKAVNLISTSELPLKDKTVNISSENTSNLIFAKNGNDKLNIDENLLSEIEKTSNSDHGKKASLLNSYIIQILIKRKNGEKIIFSNDDLYKMIAYTINTTDPLYYKYYYSEDVFWGKHSFGDSRGGSSLSEALLLGKYLSLEDLTKLTKDFEENQFYNLKDLKNIMKKTSWFEP